MLLLIHGAIGVSYWAKHHVHKARLLLVICFIFLTILSILLGQLMYIQDISIPVNIFWIALFIYVFSLSFYPTRKKHIRQDSGVKHYLNRKLCDVLLAASTFIMIFQQVNSFSWDVDRPFAAALVQRAHAARPIKVNIPESSWKNQKVEWRQKFKLFLNSVKQISKGEKLALTVLAVALAIVLLFGIGMLSCNLSCSGAEGAAGAVVFFGVIGVVLLFVLFMRYLNRKTET